jgi:hypothetical protein
MGAGLRCRPIMSARNARGVRRAKEVPTFQLTDVILANVVSFA